MQADYAQELGLVQREPQPLEGNRRDFEERQEVRLSIPKRQSLTIISLFRFLVLDHMSRERTEMVMFYLEDLKKRGPPAPITSQSKRTIEAHRK